MNTLNVTLSELQKETFEYLTHQSNNQIRGFYEFDGYWKKKEEALKELSPSRKENLKELHAYMNSITIEQVVKATQESGREWLHKYGKHGGRGRTSDAEIYARKEAYCHAKSPFIIKNMEILNRVKLHVGFCLGIFPKETLTHINEVANSELKSTFYTHPKSQLSNAIFRLEILKSYLVGGKYEKAVNVKLKEVSGEMKIYLEKEVGILDLDGYKKEIAPVNDLVSDIKQGIVSAKNDIKALEEKLTALRTQRKEIDAKYNVGEYGQILNYL